MIITKTEIKALLKINNTDNDLFIELNLPLIDQTICDYCNTDFIDKEFDYFSSGEIHFDSTDNSINMININTKKLAVYDSIRVYKSLRNNQSFTVDSISANKLIVNSIDTINTEEEGYGVFITRINYPKPLKLIASKMMNFLISESIDSKAIGVKTEKIDDYSITYSDNFNGFPVGIITMLNQYRQLYKIDLFNCTRKGV